MNCRPFNAILLSPALVGLAVLLVTPAAHGHGNNPKISGHFGGGWPHDPPGRGPLINLDVVEPYTPVNAFGPGGGPKNPFDIPGGLGTSPKDLFADPGAATAMGLSTSALLEPTMVLLDPIAPPTAMSAIGPDRSFDADPFAGTGLIDIPLTRAIPSPGTLALLGLAAIIVRRRRRG